MSTRSAIARRKGDGFEGRYHHWDGYPTGVGQTLWQLYHGHFEHNLPQMLHFLLDEHTGWSTINGRDFNQQPGYEEDGFRTGGPACYCHGGRNEEGWLVNQDEDAGMEWAYVFDEESGTMSVLERIRTHPDFAGHHAIGMFGSLGAHKDTGERDDKWVIRWAGPLEGQEPNWEEIGQISNLVMAEAD